VALVGADGSGKSSMVTLLHERREVPIVVVYAGDNPERATPSLPTTRLLWWYRRRRGIAPVHGPPPLVRGRRPLVGRVVRAPRSVLLVANQCAEEWSRLRLARRLADDGKVVVLDRSYLHDYYHHDVSAPARSPGQRLHGWWLCRVLPRADLTVVLDAPAELLYARKPEGAYEALEHRRQEYLSLPRLTAGWVVVDVSRPIKDVEREIIEAIRGLTER
jgi:thymidylate kinase